METLPKQCLKKGALKGLIRPLRALQGPYGLIRRFNKDRHPALGKMFEGGRHPENGFLKHLPQRGYRDPIFPLRLR